MFSVTVTSTSEALATATSASRSRGSIAKTKLVGEIKQCLICEDAVISNPTCNAQGDNNGLNGGGSDNKSGKNAELCEKFCKLSLQYLASQTTAQEFDLILNGNVDLDSSSLEVCGKCESQLGSFLKMYNQWLNLKIKLNQNLRDIANLVKARMKNLSISTDYQNQGQDQNQRKSRRKQELKEFSTTDTKSLQWKTRFLLKVNDIVQVNEPEPPQAQVSTTVSRSPIKNSRTSAPSTTPATSPSISSNSNFTRRVRPTPRVPTSPADGTGRRHRCRIGFCNKAFFTGSDRNRHERTHNPERRFRCHLCESGFDQSSNLLRHLELLHNIKRDPLLKRMVNTNRNDKNPSYKSNKARRDRINFQRQLRQQNHSKGQASASSGSNNGSLLHRDHHHRRHQNAKSPRNTSNTPIVAVDMNVEVGEVFPVKMEVVDLVGYRDHDHQNDKNSRHQEEGVAGAKTNITLPEIDTNLLGFDEEEMDSDLD